MVEPQRMNASRNWPNLVYNNQCLDEAEKRIQITEYLLKRESQNEKPPLSGFENICGLFEVPFESDTYINWVSYHHFIYKVFSLE